MVALVDDYDVVVIGVANMLEPYRDRVVVAELDTNKPVEDDVDIVALRLVRPARVRPGRGQDAGRQPARQAGRRLHLELPPGPRREARELGVHGYLSKALSARELVDALEAVHAGEAVLSAHRGQARTPAR